jgi:hypothetical protein
MEQEQVEKFKVWFGDYVAGFYGENEYVNANIQLKEDHTHRVIEEMLFLADALGLDEKQKRTAEVIALFHDIGRFEQFIKYRTYNDPRSCNHCLLGLDVLHRTKVLDSLETEEKQLIESAIEYHGQRQLPADLDGRCLLLSKLIRDADKIDIFYVVTDYYAQYRDDPEGFKLEIELPNEPWYSEQVIDRILNGQRVDYSILHTWNDMKLCQLAWVYDVNFAQTLNRLKQRGFMELIFDFLPQTEDIEKVRKKIFSYVDSRIRKNV